jgi:ureidoacrylate peracid hydrolase
VDEANNERKMHVNTMAKPMLKTLAQKVSPQNSAVLVVDVQNDYCAPEGGLARLGVDMSAIAACVPKIATLVDGARQTGVPVIHIRTHVEAATESPAWMELRLRRSPDRPRWCEPGTWGADFYRVAPEPGEIIITKHRYSGFINTNLDLILRSTGISSLIMTGVASNNCVDCTARDGFMNDYYIVFVDDCTAATNAAIHAATLATSKACLASWCSPSRC